MGCDSQSFARMPRRWSFNPRTHMGCDGQLLPSFRTLCRFNPRTHMGCDQEGTHVYLSGGVSIHAPTWGATSSLCSVMPNHSRFNPRTHMGCDRQAAEEARQRAEVSIHAPTWGATPPLFSLYQRFKVSIHAPTWGATIRPGRERGSDRSFNPRTHMGCDAVP